MNTLSPSAFLIVWTILVASIAYGIAALIYWRRGVKRGREMERMEPPPHGEMHFRDGTVTQLAAIDALDAIEQIRQHAARAYANGSRNYMGGWD